MANREAYDYRNTENVIMNRSTFRRQPKRYGSTSQGYLCPFFLKEIIPGDTAHMDLAGTVRQLIAPKFPVMDNVRCDVFSFFVPNRLTWEHWKEFMGPENNVSAWTPSTVYQVPAIDPYQFASSDFDYPMSIANVCHVGSLWDKFGLPIYMSGDTTTNDLDSGIKVSALPFRGYKLIWNEFFRDENLQDPVLVNLTDTAVPSDYTADTTTTAAAHPLLRACKLHDRFTSCLKAAQKGDPVSLFSSLLLPVITGKDDHNGGLYDLHLLAGFNGLKDDLHSLEFQALNNGSGGYTTGKMVADTDTATATDPVSVKPRNLYASFVGSGQGLTVNDFRASFAMQRVLEADARGGTRYIEMLRNHFSVTSPDSRMQRPEYLGGMSFDLNVNQVVQVSSTSGSDYLGATGAYSKTSALQNGVVHRNLLEHGFLMFLVTFRVEHTYSENIAPFWTRQDRFDYYFPSFDHLGEQPVKNHEIYFSWNYTQEQLLSGKVSGTFGFQPAFQDMRDDINTVTGILRPRLNNGLQGWTYADVYDSLPTLSAGFIEEPSSNVQRSLIVPSADTEQFIFDFTFRSAFTRVMSQSGIPGLIDHY